MLSVIPLCYCIKSIEKKEREGDREGGVYVCIMHSSVIYMQSSSSYEPGVRGLG